MENEADKNNADETFWTEKGKTFLKSNKDTLWYKSTYMFKNHIAISLIYLSIYINMDEKVQTDKHKILRLVMEFFFFFS